METKEKLSELRNKLSELKGALLDVVSVSNDPTVTAALLKLIKEKL